MYKFSRYHVVVFYGFFFPLTDFRQNSSDFWQNLSENRQDEFQEKNTDLLADNSAKPAEFRYSRILLFLRPLHCVSAEFF
jgi:hypothetical protein